MRLLGANPHPLRVEEMHVTVRGAQHNGISCRRRASSAYLGDQRMVRAGAHMGIRSLAEALNHGEVRLALPL